MASAFETQSTLTGLFKDVYEDKIVNLVPESSVLQKRIKFVENDKREGRLLHQPDHAPLASLHGGRQVGDARQISGR